MECPSTYRDWCNAVIKAQDLSVETGHRIYIYFRKSYGFTISEFGNWDGDHYALIHGLNRVEINKRTTKRLGRLWKR